VEKKPLLLNVVPEGHYYWVLNVEYNIIDDLDRPREIGTFQIDVGNAQRFDIHYANEKGEREYPVIIHTAVIGGLERYLFALLDSAVRMERQGKKPMLPVWVSPVQARVIPLSKQMVKDGMTILEKLEEAGIRADLDDRDDTLQSRIRDAELSWVPYIVVFGERELKSEKLSVRVRFKNKVGDPRISVQRTYLSQAVVSAARLQEELERILQGIGFIYRHYAHEREG